MNRYTPLVLIAALMTCGDAVAHARLLQSSPTPDAQLLEAPKTLILTFSEAAQLAVLKIVASGKQIPVVVDHNAKASSIVTVTLPALQPGVYLVEWSALAADDGHVTHGQFGFSLVAQPQKTN